MAVCNKLEPNRLLIIAVASLSAIHAGNEARESGERSTAKWSPSALQIENGIRLFFHHVAHAVPFLHEPTFDSASAKEHLVLSILCLGYYYGEDPDVGRRPGSGVELALKCYRRALEVVESNETSRSNSAQHLVIVQTYLLLQVCAMFYIGGDYSWDGRRIHSTVIAVCRSGFYRCMAADAMGSSALTIQRFNAIASNKPGGHVGPRVDVEGIHQGRVAQEVSGVPKVNALMTYPASERCSSFTTWTPCGTNCSPSPEPSRTSKSNTTCLAMTHYGQRVRPRSGLTGH